VTATPALISGVPYSSSSSGPADAAAVEDGDASFGRALEQVFLSALDALKDGGPGRGKIPGSKLGDEAERDGDGLQETAQMPDRTGPANLVLATLQSSVSAGTAATGAATVEASATGPRMPGQVAGGDGEFDAGQLLDVLSTDPSRGAVRDVKAGTEFTENTTLRVLRRETHLAVVRTPVNVSATLDGLDEATRAAALNTAPAQSVPVADNDGSLRPIPAESSPLGAAVARSQGDGGQMRRVAPNVQGDAPALDTAGQTGAAASFAFEEASQHAADQQAGGDARQGSRGERETASQTSSPIAIALDTRTQAVRNASGEVIGETPVEQIFSELRSELDVEPVMQTSSDGAKKVLHLELKPASLGSVTVRIALKDNVVTLHLEAQRSDTLAAIERDREALAGALKSAGYSVDAITSSVQSDAGRLSGAVAAAADASATASQGNAQGSFTQSAGEGAANSSGQGGSGQPTSEKNDERTRGRTGENGRVSQGGSDGLYV
jgi:chemotaxis protein MotD